MTKLTITLPTHERCTSDPCGHCAAGLPDPPPDLADGAVTGLWELDEDVRLALPPHFHQPYFAGLGKPAMWVCTACWGDGWQSGWPCKVAAAHGVAVAHAIGAGWSW